MEMTARIYIGLTRSTGRRVHTVNRLRAAQPVSRGSIPARGKTCFISLNSTSMATVLQVWSSTKHFAIGILYGVLKRGHLCCNIYTARLFFQSIRFGTHTSQQLLLTN
jgi:hypothetical protein